ncbi:MAG: ATP-binding protein, partial [Pseudomonadota bacterium]
SKKMPTVELVLKLLDTRHAKINIDYSENNHVFKSGLLQLKTIDQQGYHRQSAFSLASFARYFLLEGSLSNIDLSHIAEALTSPYKIDATLPFSQKRKTKIHSLSAQLKGLNQPIRLLFEVSCYSAAYFIADFLLLPKHIKRVSLHYEKIAQDKHQLLDGLRFIIHYALLANCAIVIDLSKVAIDRIDPLTLCLVVDTIERSDVHLLLMVPHDRLPPCLSQKSYYHYSVPPLDVAERATVWRYFLDRNGMFTSDQTLDFIADTFCLDFQQIEIAIKRLAAGYDNVSSRHKPINIGLDILLASVKQQSHSEIAQLADKVTPRFSLDDLILPREILTRIQEIIAAVSSRKQVYEHWGFGSRLGYGRGLASLFAGASGTGKTMAASVIAGELGLDMYRVDLSRIVSKYIGETEKNLDKIFTAAREANCILFFDEAEALFGKRSEVKDAHDRYANVELAYLLQKIEHFDGVVIMTTNLSKNIDQAFTRRLQYIIDFPRPDEVYREKIWRRMFTEKAPLDDGVDFNFLARQFSNTGGDIKNIVLDAALMAANSTSQRIDMPILLRASARQMIKQGKVPSPSEFKHYFELVNVQRTEDRGQKIED